MAHHRALPLPLKIGPQTADSYQGKCASGEGLVDLGQLPKFEHTRARFIRASDLAEFLGWVVGERNLRFVIQFDGEHSLAEGQELFGEISLLEWKLKLRTRVNQVLVRDGENVSTVVVMEATNLNALHGTGRERFRVQGLKASVHAGPKCLAPDCTVLDISMDGLGLSTSVELPVGTMVKVCIDQGPDHFEFDCEVRYVRKSGKGYRTGLVIHHNDRVGKRKWNNYLGDLNRRTNAAA